MLTRGFFVSSIFLLSAITVLSGCSRYGDYNQPVDNVQGVGIAAVGKWSARHYLGAPTLGASLGAGVFLYERLSPNYVIKRLQSAGVNVFVIGDTLQINLMADRIFDPDGVHIRLERYSVMNDVAALLNRYSQQPIHLTGHSDDQGDLNDQHRRSRAQAEAIMAFLTSHSVPPQRFKTRGAGMLLSSAENISASGHADNRYITLTTCKDDPSLPVFGQLRHWF